MPSLNDIIEAIKSPDKNLAGMMWSGIQNQFQANNVSSPPMTEYAPGGPGTPYAPPMWNPGAPSIEDTMMNIGGPSEIPGGGGGGIPGEIPAGPGGPGAPGDPNAPMTLQGMLQQYWQQTGKVRDPLIEQLAAFLGGEGVPGMTALYEPGRQAINQQYGDARERIMSTLPAGGGLQTALGDLETGKAGSLVDLMGDITGQAYDKAYGLSMTSPGTTFGGMGLLEQIAAQLEMGGMQIDANDTSTLEGIAKMLPLLFLL